MWELDCEGWAAKNWCFWTVELEKTPERPLDCKEIQTVHYEGDQPWRFFGRNDAKAETPVLWTPHEKSWLIGKDWCWEGLGSGGEGDDRGWDGWMASLTRWTWVWVNSGRWWRTGRPGMLRFMGSQRVGHDWATKLKLKMISCFFIEMLIPYKFTRFVIDAPPKKERYIWKNYMLQQTCVSYHKIKGNTFLIVFLDS